MCVFFDDGLGKQQRKVLYPKPPLSAHIFGGEFFFQRFKKNLFFLSGQALTLPPFCGLPTLKITFLWLPLKHRLTL